MAGLLFPDRLFVFGAGLAKAAREVTHCYSGVASRPAPLRLSRMSPSSVGPTVLIGMYLQSRAPMGGKLGQKAVNQSL